MTFQLVNVIMDSWETDLNASTLETSIMVSANEIANVQVAKIAS